MTSKKLIQQPLKDVIISLLKKDGMSIASLCNKLKTVGINIHRLTLTGYLKAMVDVGILSEREIKPAKVYKVQTGKIKNIYDAIGMKSREFDEKSADICLYTLHRLFKRPIFKMELEKCAVNKPIKSKRVFGRERAKALEMLEENKIMLIPNFSSSS